MRTVPNDNTYSVKYDDAILFLELVEPYLVIHSKKDKARLILSEYKSITPRNGRYSDDLFELKEAFYQRFMSL